MAMRISPLPFPKTTSKTPGPPRTTSARKKKTGQRILRTFSPKKCEKLFTQKKCGYTPPKKWSFPAKNPDFTAKNKHLFQTAELDKQQDFVRRKLKSA